LFLEGVYYTAGEGPGELKPVLAIR
jgi:hypothetical protein